MQHVARLILIPLLAAAMTGGVWATENAKETTLPTAEYKRSDTNFYPKADVVQAHPSAVILPEGSFTRKGDSYFFTPHKKAPKEMYVETLNDWIEPITPPDMPASLGVPPDAMQIREPRGDVQAALPSAPANFLPVTDGMTLPNGAVLKTGADGTAAVLFGGVDSARLMPNSAAAVQQTVTAQARSAEVDLTAGGVFSKVGTQVGVKGEYEVHTPFGNAGAAGGDFVTMISGSRTDVWVAQGTVELHPPDAQAMVATSDATGALKIIRFPLSSDPHQALLADAETLTAILNFIPMANQKIKALRDKATGGATLTANEQAYLNRIKQVPALIKLALVEPPAPEPAAPVATTPAAEVPAPHLALGEPLPYTGPPEEIDLRSDGKVDLNGETVTLDGLKSRLAAAAQLVPNQPVVIKGREKVAHDQLKKVLAICKAAKLKKVTVAKALPIAPTPPPVAPAAANPPATNPPAPAAASAPAATPALPPPASTAPIRAVVRIDGKINFQGVTFTPAEFKSRLEAIIKMTPDQAIVIKAGKTVPYEKFEAVMDICHSAQVKNLTVATPAPTPKPVAPAAAEPAANLPAPGLLMHSPADSMSSNAAPMSPSGLPAPTPSTPNTNTPAGNPPTTNTPASAAP